MLYFGLLFELYERSMGSADSWRCSFLHSCSTLGLAQGFFSSPLQCALRCILHSEVDGGSF